MNAIFRTSAEGLYAFSLNSRLVDQLLSYCRESGVYETGGVLVGYYGRCHQEAVVTRVSGPPTSSERTRWSFVRAVGHLQDWLDQLWLDYSDYYLGEWHFHPGGSANPSRPDLRQMRSIARNAKYSCPEPILLIIGGNPEGSWSWSTTVHLANGKVVALTEGNPLCDPNRHS